MPSEVPLIVFFAVVLPIFVIGAIIATFIFFRSKEKQMLISQGIPPEQIAEMWKKNARSYPYFMLKLGIIVLFFGFGLGLGLLIEVYSGVNQWVPFLIFTFTGAGFIAAHFVARAQEIKDNQIKNGK